MSEPMILVPLDGSEFALAALPVALALGQIEQAPVQILHVGKPGTASGQPPGRLPPMPDGFAVEIRMGVPGAEIVRAADEMKPRLIVMCKHCGAGPERMLGTAALSVLQGASCPVVLVPPARGPAPWHLHHVIVPHDGTPTTSAALHPAAELAEHGRAELLVAHVTNGRAASAEPGSLPAPHYVDQPQHEWPAWTNEFIKRLACVCPLGSVRVRMNLAHGDPAAEILRLSETQATDLIVIAWRGRWEMPRAAILKEILREAPCPIMVVRAGSYDTSATPPRAPPREE
jgi:nucleotide-binding universal stress UspA family protein